MDLEERPLIVTLVLNAEAQQYFGDIRSRYFPAYRNYLDAHLTLFHALPGNGIPSVSAKLSEISAETYSFLLGKKGWKSIGKGVAYTFHCEELLKLHMELQKQWKKWLSPQDAQKLWPHITIQNKVTSAEANETLNALREMEPPVTEGIGLNLYYYDNGPWEFIKSFDFLPLSSQI